MRFFELPFLLLIVLSLTGCIGNMNPTGGNSSPNYPYYVTTEAIVVKKIAVPIGTTLTYDEHFFKSGEQNKMMPERQLITIDFPEGQPMDWGGVPVTMIHQFYNTEMRGYSVYADFEQLSADKRTRFSQLWESCSEDLGITIKNRDDWSFNVDNIANVESCSVIYQRYFEDDAEQQDFLDDMLAELIRVGSK